MKLNALTVTNVRVFEGTHRLPLAPGLNVFVGKNNSGKSTLLRVPGLVSYGYLHDASAPTAEAARTGAQETGLEVEISFSGGELRSIAPVFASALSDARLRSEQPRQAGPEIRVAAHPDFLDWAAPSGEPVSLGLGIRRVAGESNVSFRVPSSRQTPQVVRELRWWRQYSVETTPAYNTMVLAAAPDVNTFVAAFRDWFRTGPLGSWAHRPTGGTGSTFGQPARRLQSDEDAAVKEALVFLKMKHDAQFERLAASLQRALPEFGRLDFDDDYKPAFKLGSVDQLLNRNFVGAGSWTFLAILAAAHTGVATGMQVLALDEPHLHLHPGLERRLVRELMNTNYGAGSGPPQLLVATHSPVFLDAAWRDGKVYLLDWADETRTTVVPQELSADDIRRHVRSAVSTTSVADLVYADRVVFVEGPSDATALAMLTGGETIDGVRLRFEPLREPDNVGKREVVRALRVVSRGFRSGGPVHRPVLCLDRDKQGTVDKDWDKWADEDPNVAFEVRWLGLPGHDAESLFADEAFLVALFRDLSVVAGEERVVEEVRAAVDAITANQAPGREQKASQMLAKLHESLRGADDTTRSKKDLLEVLVEFYFRSGTKLARVEELRNALTGGRS
ncbi:MAG: AAA family ATPase [Sandaracinus sp.]